MESRQNELQSCGSKQQTTKQNEMKQKSLSQLIHADLKRELKQELIRNYKKRGYKNCLGSVESVVEELFSEASKQVSESEGKERKF